MKDVMTQEILEKYSWPAIKNKTKKQSLTQKTVPPSPL